MGCEFANRATLIKSVHPSLPRFGTKNGKWMKIEKVPTHGMWVRVGLSWRLVVGVKEKKGERRAAWILLVITSPACSGEADTYF